MADLTTTCSSCGHVDTWDTWVAAVMARYSFHGLCVPCMERAGLTMRRVPDEAIESAAKRVASNLLRTQERPAR